MKKSLRLNSSSISKLIKYPAIVAIVYLFPAGHAQSTASDAMINVCNIVKIDDIYLFRKRVNRFYSETNLKLNNYYQDIYCEGDSLIRTAILNNAIKTGALIVKKLPRSELIKSEKDGKTILDWVLQKNIDNSKIIDLIKLRS